MAPPQGCGWKGPDLNPNGSLESFDRGPFQNPGQTALLSRFGLVSGSHRVHTIPDGDGGGLRPIQLPGYGPEFLREAESKTPKGTPARRARQRHPHPVGSPGLVRASGGVAVRGAAADPQLPGDRAHGRAGG